MNWVNSILTSSIILLVSLAGCSHISIFQNPDNGKIEPQSMLPPIPTSSDSVGLEIFFIRRSVSAEDWAKDIWENVSEIPFPEQTRQKLRLNGFRFGVLGSAQTSTLVDMLNLVNPGSQAHADSWEDAIQFVKDEKVMRRYVELTAGQPAEALASDIYDHLTVLQKTDESLGGDSYQEAQCVFRLISAPRPDAAVDLTILPEIQYGQPRQQYVFEQGSVKMEYGRNRKTFESLQMKVKLKPGEMVVLSSRSDQTASLGSQFFSDATIRGDFQKIMILRLARWKCDPLFPENGIKKSDCVNEPIVKAKPPERIEPVVIDIDDKKDPANTDSDKKEGKEEEEAELKEMPEQ